MPKEVEYPKLVMPDNVTRHTVSIWSNGVALDADIYRPRELTGTRLAAAVAMSHGLGGNKLTAERYAAKFAAAGMIAVSFTHAGWFGSGSRLVLAGEPPQLDSHNEGTARVRAIRELIDPLEWIQNFRAAVDYLEGEENVDPTRIGAWGTSFGGGIAMYNAMHDVRLKALAVQVPFVAGLSPAVARHAKQRAIDMARGKIPSVPQGIDAIPLMPGTPFLARQLQYHVLGDIDRLNVPTLVRDVGNEEMFDIKENGGQVYETLKRRGGVPVDYKVIPDVDHYGIYFAGFDEGSEAALAWFRLHLESPSSSSQA